MGRAADLVLLVAIGLLPALALLGLLFIAEGKFYIGMGTVLLSLLGTVVAYYRFFRG